MLPGSIFVSPIDSLLFSVASVHIKRDDVSLHRCFYAVLVTYSLDQTVVSYYLLHVTCINETNLCHFMCLDQSLSNKDGLSDIFYHEKKKYLTAFSINVY